MFLVGYVVFQLPGTLLIKKIRAPVQFWGAMILVWKTRLGPVIEIDANPGRVGILQWGLFTTLTVLVKTPGQLIAMRFLIGTAEAFVQGAAFCTYLVDFFPIRHLFDSVNNSRVY